MPGCAVANCINNDKNSKDKEITFHRIPKDEGLRKAWIHACKRADDFNANNVKVCSCHFSDDDFERDLQSELLNVKPKRKLRTGAIPRLNIPTIQCAFVNIERIDRIKKRENKKILKSITDESYNRPNNVLDKVPLTVNIQCMSNENNETLTSSLKEVIPDLATNESILKEIDSLKHKNITLEKQMQRVSEELAVEKNKNLILQNKLLKFQQLFSDNQLQVIDKGSCPSWSSEDISKAVTLRCISKKCFDYVRKYLRYPLPSERTIKRRLSNIHISPGFINLSLDLLKSHANVFTDAEKDVILSYDEMKIKPEICYDSVEDIFRGPHNNLQMVVVRSLIGKWKQPVFYDFDKPINKHLFYEIVDKVEKTGFKVRGFVSDMGPCNQKLLSDLAISENRTSIPNPTNIERRIWGFCDVPHLLKLLRNHLLDEGYELSDGKLVKKDVLEKVVSSESNDLKFVHKVTPNHFLLKGTERQNVRKAAELLSGTMASAIGYLCENQEHVKCFLQTVNDGFDVLNSRTPMHPNKLKSGYGMFQNEQNEALTKLYDLCSSMRVAGKKNLLPFQKGFLISINSIKGLYSDLKNEGYLYLMTSRCNQDVLEGYFSMIRGFGRFYDHPLPTAVSQRIKSLLLSRNASSLIKNGNCSNDEECITLSENVINDAVGHDGDVNVTNKTDLVSDEEEEFVEYGLKDSQNIDNVFKDMPNSDLLKMLAGYIAFRVKKKKLSSNFVYGHPTNECTNNQRDWLSTLSKGFLMNPTEEWLTIVRNMESDFFYYHEGNGLSKEKGVMKNLINKLKSKYPLIDEFAIACYVRTRSFMRMKSLNRLKSNKRMYGNNASDFGRKIKKNLVNCNNLHQVNKYLNLVTFCNARIK